MTRSDDEHLPEADNSIAPARHRGAAAVSSGLAALSALAVVVGLVLSALNGLSVADVFEQFLAVNAVVALSFSVVGALIVRRRPGNCVGWLLCVIGVLCAAATLAGPYARYALLTRAGAVGGMAAAWINHWIWVLPVGLASLVLPLVVPDGRLPSPRWRAAGALSGLTLAVLLVSVMADPTPDASLPEVSNPLPLDVVRPLLPVLRAGLAPLVIASFVSSIAAVVARFRRSRGDERKQVEWLGFALCLVVSASLVPIVFRLLGSDFFTATLTGALQAVVAPLVPIAVGIGVLRYRLYDIDVLVQRTVLYGSLTVCVVAIYIVVVGYLGALFQAEGSLAVSLVATGLVAVAFQPLRERVHGALNRVLYGYRDEPYAVLSRLGERVEAALAPAAVLEAIVDTVRETLKLPYAAIAVADAGRPTVAVESGRPPPDTLRVP